MDYKEEQAQELEVLESIYPDELRMIRETYPGIKFEVELKLELQELIEDTVGHLSKNHTLHVTFELPETYPDENPLISIDAEETAQGYGDDSGDEEDEEEDEQQYDEHGNRLMSRYENIPDTISLVEYAQGGTLVREIEEQIETDMLNGMQMCFALISSIKEKAEQHFVEELTIKQQQHEKELQAREKEEQAKFHGTKVTRESFLAWRETFRKELNLDKRDEQRRMEAHHGRLTGRQMFEQGVEGTLDDIDETDLDETTDKLKNL
ncbi:Protein GIR2 [Nakaseomyces bracarensis]|uniref:Protein GIR2 n=1 Tax=Nakaseomyces bracarensis TaxID=273131 RepID=A0ABR4NT37_9SACH